MKLHDDKPCQFCGAPTCGHLYLGEDYLCWDCSKSYDADRKTKRKAELGEMLRCEVEGCDHRATMAHGTTAICRLDVCGWHSRNLKRISAKRKSKVPGAFLIAGYFPWIDQADMLQAAVGVDQLNESEAKL